MSKEMVLDRTEVVCGKPLPFSVFDPSRKLLLATKGQIVTERMREALLRNGLIAMAENGTAHMTQDQCDEVPASPLLHLRQRYGRASMLARSGFRMSRDERSECYSCQVIGIGERRSLILTAPVRDDRNYVAISEGQSWLFRTFYATAAIRFTGIIEKLVFDPFPYFHVDVPAQVEMRHIRRMQRVAVCMDTMLNLAQPTEGLIVDLSSTGMRLALPEEIALQESQRFDVQFKVQVLDEWHAVRARATVARCLGAADSQHPQIHFYGAGVEPHSERDRLLLHAFVQSCVIRELDGLSRILAS